MKKLCIRLVAISLFIVFINLQAINPDQEKQKNTSFAQRWLTPEVKTIVGGGILLTIRHAENAHRAHPALDLAGMMLILYQGFISGSNAGDQDQSCLAFLRTVGISIAALGSLEALGITHRIAKTLKLCTK